MMNGPEKSDLCHSSEEAGEQGRTTGGGVGGAKGGGQGEHGRDRARTGHRAGQVCHRGLTVYEKRARQRKKERFTALLHHVRRSAARQLLLAEAGCGTRRGWRDVAGVRGRTWKASFVDLHARVHRGAYRALPSRRKFIPKADGRATAAGIAALEDKIVQRAVVEVLNAIYEEDFLGFSYGFRPGRSQHDALDALAFGISRTKGELDCGRRHSRASSTR